MSTHNSSPVNTPSSRRRNTESLRWQCHHHIWIVMYHYPAYGFFGDLHFFCNQQMVDLNCIVINKEVHRDDHIISVAEICFSNSLWVTHGDATAQRIANKYVQPIVTKSTQMKKKVWRKNVIPVSLWAELSTLILINEFVPFQINSIFNLIQFDLRFLQEIHRRTVLRSLFIQNSLNQWSPPSFYCSLQCALTFMLRCEPFVMSLTSLLGLWWHPQSGVQFTVGPVT